MTWTDEDDRQIRRMLGHPYESYLKTRRWRRLAIASMAVAGVQAVVIVVIAAMVIGRWLTLG